MSASLRRVLVRRPATGGDLGAAGWRVPDPALLARPHEEVFPLLTGLDVPVGGAGAVDGLVDAGYMPGPRLVHGGGGPPP